MPIVRTLHTYMNDGKMPDIHAYNLTPCTIATHENYVLRQDLGLDPTEEPPPKELPPPIHLILERGERRKDTITSFLKDGKNS